MRDLFFEAIINALDEEEKLNRVSINSKLEIETGKRKLQWDGNKFKDQNKGVKDDNDSSIEIIDISPKCKETKTKTFLPVKRIRSKMADPD